jgi:hypothetical protein
VNPAHAGKSAFVVSLLLAWGVSTTGWADPVDLPVDDAEPPSALEEGMDAIGLFRAGLDVDELDASGPILDDPAVSEAEEDESADVDPGAPPSRFEPFVAPLPFRSPSLGWGGALTLGSIVHPDPVARDTPPSTVAIAGFGSENESFGGVFSFRGHVLGDHVRPRFAFAMGRANYEFFGIGSDAGSAGRSADLRTEFIVVRAMALVQLPTQDLGRLGRGLYLGPLLEYRENEHSVRSVSGLPPSFPLPNFDEDDLGLGFAIERDTRNNNFAPSGGTLLEFESRFFSESLGGDEDYQTYDLSLASYHDVGSRTVLAWRGLGRLSSGDVPFNELGQHDLRGYERGRYRDEVHLAGEVELRRPLLWRFGGVVYGGLGQVAPKLSELDGDNLLWSVGFGLRFQLTRESPLNYRADVGWGRDGFEFYFSLGEEF